MAGAQLQFELFTDEIVAWENKDALNQFFTDIRVPLATVGAAGVISRQGDSVAYTIIPLVNSDEFNLVLDEAGSLGQVPSAQSFNELKAAFVTTQIALNTLIEKLRQSGVILT